MVLHKEIKRLRKEMLMNQKEFANIIGVSRVHYSNIENRNCYPTLDLLQKIESATGKKLIITFIDES